MKPVLKYFGDAEYNFALTPALVIELEKKCDAGIGVIAGRVFNKQFALSDLSEIIRLSLIGSGLSASRAHELVTAYLSNHALVDAHEIASAIMERLMFGEPPANEAPHG